MFTLLYCFVMFSHVMTENNTVAGGFISRLVLARLSHIWLFLIPPSSDFEKVFTYCIATIICLFVRKYESIQSKYHLNMIGSHIANDICTCH